MKTLKTAPQILEHYVPALTILSTLEDYKPYILKAMRHYARVKSEKAYEKGYQMAINHLT